MPVSIVPGRERSRAKVIWGSTFVLDRALSAHSFFIQRWPASLRRTLAAVQFSHKGNGRDSLSAVLQYFRNPMYLSVYILEMTFHPIGLGGHYVLWRSALQEHVDVVERSRDAADRKLEPLNRNRAAPKHEIMARLQKACNHVRYFVRGVAPTPLGEHLKSCPSVSFDIFADASNSFVRLRSGNNAEIKSGATYRKSTAAASAICAQITTAASPRACPQSRHLCRHELTLLLSNPLEPCCRRAHSQAVLVSVAAFGGPSSEERLATDRRCACCSKITCLRRCANECHVAARKP